MICKPLQRAIGVAALFSAAFLGYAGETAAAVTHVVCPADSKDSSCKYRGNGGIQAAIDAAGEGDTVLLKAGTYAPDRYRDVPYKQYVIRGFIVLDHKRVHLRGEPGAVLDGGTGLPVTAIIVNGGAVRLSGLTIRGFRADQEEDDLYEGHGIFVIDAAAHIDEVTIERYKKMGLTGRGSTQLQVNRLRILDGHVAIWLEEYAHLQLCNSVVRNNDSAGIAAYGNSSAKVFNSIFDGSQDDGLYTENDAAITATNSLFLRNKPYAARAKDNSRIAIAHSVLFGNEQLTSEPKDGGAVQLGAGIVKTDPQLDAQLRTAKALTGDPNVRDAAGKASFIGLSSVAGCGSF